MTAAREYPPIVVLLGGPSAEHDVSVVSGTAIAAALMDAGLDVTQVVTLPGAVPTILPLENRSLADLRCDRCGRLVGRVSGAAEIKCERCGMLVAA